MKEVLYVIAGKRLPVVFHVGARALTSQALNIHAGHDDVMAVADTRLGDPRSPATPRRSPTSRRSPAASPRRPRRRSSSPRTASSRPTRSRTSLLPEDELLREFVGEPRPRVRDLFDPAEALMTGVVQNQDSYMKGRIGQRVYTDRVAGRPRRRHGRVAPLTGRGYGLIDAYRTEDAADILVAMGTIADTAIAVVDHLRAQGRPSAAWR
jgi:pyruvate-ferredoxin/flavodoxin oxidoreductase